MASISFEVERHIATISENAAGWTKELNYISWNGRPPKLDLREWAPERERCGKGVTLSTEEAKELYEALRSAL